MIFLEIIIYLHLDTLNFMTFCEHHVWRASISCCNRSKSCWEWIGLYKRMSSAYKMRKPLVKETSGPSPLQSLSILKINDTLLAQVPKFKYLGVWLSERLDWSIHVQAISKTAACRTVGMLYRRFSKHASSRTLIKMYTVMVRPLLEYRFKRWRWGCVLKTGPQIMKISCCSLTCHLWS